MVVVLEGVPGNDSEIKQSEAWPFVRNNTKDPDRDHFFEDGIFLVAFLSSGTRYLLLFSFFPLCINSIRQHSLRPAFIQELAHFRTSPIQHISHDRHEFTKRRVALPRVDHGNQPTSLQSKRISCNNMQLWTFTSLSSLPCTTTTKAFVCYLQKQTLIGSRRTEPRQRVGLLCPIAILGPYVQQCRHQDADPVQQPWRDDAEAQVRTTKGYGDNNNDNGVFHSRTCVKVAKHAAAIRLTLFVFYSREQIGNRGAWSLR